MKNTRKIGIQDFNRLNHFLNERLKKELPGRKAHMKLVPATRNTEFGEIPAQSRESATLLLLYPAQDVICTLLIQRPEYAGYHSGQISLPGGKKEPEDTDLLRTAMREAKEEVGIQESDIQALGALSTLFIPPSNYLMTPFIAAGLSKPDFIMDPAEVADLLEADINDFNDLNIKHKPIRLYDGRIAEMPYYDIRGKVVWGATAMVMSEFSALMGEFLMG